MVLDEELDRTCVQVGLIVLRCRAALNKVQVSARFDNDERVLELACAAGVETEVALQRVGERHALRHVDKRAARPHRVVQRGKLVVAHGDERAEVLVHHRLPLGVVQRVLDGGVDDALLGHLLAHVVVHDLGVVLGAHAGQALALGLGDAQALEGGLDVLGPQLSAMRISWKVSSALRRRSSIHWGSSFLAEMARTMSGVSPSS